MKHIKKYTRVTLFAFLFLLNSLYHAQTCTVAFTPSVTLGGVVIFSATPQGTNVPNYNWNFGNGTSTVIANMNTVAVTYTANGIYTINLTYSSTITGCTATASPVTVTVNNACTMSVSVSPVNPPNGCSGSATVTSTGICGIPSYTWLPSGVISPTINNLCPGNYTVVGYSPANCCPAMSTVINVPCPLAPNFSFGILGNGTVSFSNTSTGTFVASTYTWNYGDNSSPGSGPFTSHTYSANGTYTVNLYITNSAACGGTMVAFVTITNLPACNLVPIFTHTQTANGGVNFLSTSTGTIAGVTYSWSFGDGNGTVTASPATSHTYSSNGTYSVTLLAINNPTTNCQGDTTMNVIVNSLVPCNLNASFTSNSGANGYVSFSSTSTGTIASSTYSWNYGDNNTGSGSASSHTYSSNGTFVVKLAVYNNGACLDTSSTVITISNVVVPCLLNADFTHTVGLGGVVGFNSTSTGVNGNTNYYWDFGDGVYSTYPSPTHTYISSGAFNVRLWIIDNVNGACKDSTVYSVNVTGLACMANAAFNLSPGNQPQYWNATPVYPWNVTAATWYWGDGTFTNGLYTSHIYSVSGSYNICLTVTVSCGSSDSTCNISAIYKSSGTNETQGMIYVNIQRPGVVNAISANTANGFEFSLFPNPSRGVFNLDLKGAEAGPVNICIYNLTGSAIYEQTQELQGNELSTLITAPNISDGIYLLKITSGKTAMVKKIVISGN